MVTKAPDLEPEDTYADDLKVMLDATTARLRNTFEMAGVYISGQSFKRPSLVLTDRYTVEVKAVSADSKIGRKLKEMFSDTSGRLGARVFEVNDRDDNQFHVSHHNNKKLHDVRADVSGRTIGRFPTTIDVRKQYEKFIHDVVLNDDQRKKVARVYPLSKGPIDPA